MCGIAGFNWKDEKKIRDLCNLFNYRGPDMEGYYSDEHVSLGHKRLSIIDLSENGRQPLSNTDKSLLITFNGEIFNYEELKKEIDYPYITTTDTEVILAAYKKYGVDCLKKLNGQFAFCIYDKKKQCFFIARDRIGINPLYYYHKDNKFIFGSELKIIMGSNIKKTINQDALNYYLAYGYTPRRQSILNDVYKLEPGHYLIYNLRTHTLIKKRYWDIKPVALINNEDEAIQLIREQLEKSVKERLVADVPVGAFLSGGIDSSAVVAMISKYKKNLNTFSVKFDHEMFDESKYADMIAKKFGTKHHVVTFTAKDIKRLISKLPYYFDEPFADPSMIPTFLVSRVARKHVTVSLSGDGGDELFGGYKSYNLYYTLQILNFYPRIINKILHYLLRNIPLKILRKPTIFFEIGSLPRNLRYARLMSYMNIEDFKNLTGVNPLKAYNEYMPFKCNQYLNTAINSDIHLYLPDDILTKVDRASLGNSLESRPPLLDHKMIELAMKIHPKLKFRGKVSKYIFKKALEGILPSNIINRKKMGFGFPLEYYLKTTLKEIVYTYVFKYDKHIYFNKKYIKKLEQQYNQKTWPNNYLRILWTLLMFNLWWEEWMLD